MSRKTSAEQPRRLKVTLACIICRKKKVKCDGVQPTCSRCNSMGIQCQYSDPPKKRGPPKGYVEVINNRAHRIESLLGKQKTSSPATTSNNNHSTTTTTRPFSSPSCSSSLVSSSSTSAAAWSTSITTNNGNDRAETPVHLSASLLPQQQNDVLKLITDATSTVQAKWAYSNSNSPGSHNSMYASSPANNDDDDDSIVSSDLALLWANNVFQHFNIFFPLLSRQHFLFQLVHRKHTMNPLLRYAVYALGCRYINPEDRTARLWFNKAQVLAEHETHVSLSIVQALAIMCWYTYLAGDLQQCSRLRHQLYRAVHDCDLGHEATNCSVVEQEMRRRGLWASYVIDQWLAVCTGERIQPVTSWDVKLPKLEDNQLYAIDCRNLQPPVDLHELSVESALQVAVFAEMVKLVNVVCGISGGDDIKTALTEWLLNLPPYLEFGKATDDTPPSPIARIFHMLYYTVQVMINRPIYHHHLQQQQHQLIVDHDGTTAANTIIHIAEQMVRNHEVKYLYNVFGLSLTLATTIHLENARLFESTSANNSLTRSLSVIKQTNCTVVPCVDLDRVLHRFVVNRCGVVLDHYCHQHHHQQQQQQPRASLHQQYPYAEVRPTNLKRPCLSDDLERTVKRPSFDFSRWLPPEQQQYTIPSSSFSTTTTGDYTNLVDLFTTSEPSATTSNTTAATTDDGIVTAATAEIAAVAAAAAAGLQMDCWNSNNNEQQHSLFAGGATSSTTNFYQHSPSSSSSSPMVTPKPANPSPALTMATTPIESSPTSYFSPHANSSSPSLLSINGFDLSKDDGIRGLVSNNFYPTIDFQNTII